MSTATPTDIANTIRAARPDLDVDLDDGPAGLTLTVARHDFEATNNFDEVLLFGTAAGYLGWSNGDGEKGGGWEGIVQDTYYQWHADLPMTDGLDALARIVGIIAEELPEEL